MFGAALLGACAGPPTTAGAEGFLAVGDSTGPLVLCSRTIAPGAGAIDDLTTLRMASDGAELVATWRGEADRWYPIDVGGELTSRGLLTVCALTVDVGDGAWLVGGTCNGERIEAEAVRCD